MKLFSSGNARKEKSVSAALPYQELNSDGTILTKDWSLLKCYHVIFPDISLSPSAPDEVSGIIAQHFNRRTDTQAELPCTYWFSEIRIPMKLEYRPEESGYINMIGGDQEVEDHRIALFSDMESNLINVSYACIKVKVETENNEITDESQHRAFALFGEFEGAMRTIGAKLIELKNDAKIPEDNIITFLKSTIGCPFGLYRCPEQGLGGMVEEEGSLSDFLSTNAIEKGVPMRFCENLDADPSPNDRYVQMLTINDFPHATYPGILFKMLTLPFPFRWSTRWIPYTNRESQNMARKLRKEFQAGTKGWKATMYENSTGQVSQDVNIQASADAAAVESVMHDLAQGETLGQMTSCIEVYDNNIESLNKKIQRVKEVLNSVGFSAIVEGATSNFRAWQSSLPGENEAGRRRPLMTATNISHIVPFTDIYHGSSTDFYLKRLTGCGWPHVMGRLKTNEIFYLNLNGPKDDIGHTFIVGSTGGGKSVLLSLIGSQWARYPGSRVILFDKDMSFRNICERTGGAIYNPAAEDSPLRFMPLSRIKTNPSEVLEWLEVTIAATGTKVTPEISADLSGVVRSWNDSAPTFERFVSRLRGYNPESLAIPALNRILESKALSNLFGGEEDSFCNESFGQKTMIEMGSLMNLGDMAVYPCLQFIFSRIDELFDTDPKPTLLIMDEAWVFLNHKIFRQKIKEWLKTLRKKRVFVIMAIQNINDIDDPEEFLTSCHTKIYLANPELKGDGAPAIKEAYKRMGVSDTEIEIIGNGTRKKHYFIQQDEGSALVDFCVDSYQLQRLARDGQ